MKADPAIAPAMIAAVADPATTSNTTTTTPVNATPSMTNPA
jgi:hypothetical protein